MKDYTSTRKKVELSIDGKVFSIQEFTGLLKDKYFAAMGDKVEVTTTPEGKSVARVKSFEGLQTLLVQHCLYDENGSVVSPEFVGNLPATVLDDLFKEAQKINGLDITPDKAKEAEKKD